MTSFSISSLGAMVHLIGVTGTEPITHLLREELDKRNIRSHLIQDQKRKTTFKTRIIGEKQQVVRIDYESTEKISEDIEKEVIEKVKSLIGMVDIVLISDYNKGVITKNLAEEIIKLCNDSNKKVVIDPKPQNKDRYKNAFLVTPNDKESFDMTGIKNIEERGKKIREELNSNVLLTLGAKGMTLFEKGGAIKEFPTEAREVFEVSGAGDTVVATIALGLASNSSLDESVILANHAAGIVVGKIGTVPIKSKELRDIFKIESKKLKSMEELKEIIELNKENGKKIVTTTGFFDLLHFGHIKLLQDAKKQGDILILGINTDESVRNLKGPTRPILKQDERANILAALDCVDYVCMFNEETPIDLLTELKPDIHVKGADKKMDEIIERNAIEKNGGKVVLLPITGGSSTTQIIDKILEGYKEG